MLRLTLKLHVKRSLGLTVHWSRTELDTKSPGNMGSLGCQIPLYIDKKIECWLVEYLHRDEQSIVIATSSFQFEFTAEQVT